MLLSPGSVETEGSANFAGGAAIASYNAERAAPTFLFLRVHGNQGFPGHRTPSACFFARPQGGERKGCVGMSPFHYECGSGPDAQGKAMGAGNVFPRATLRSKAFARA